MLEESPRKRLNCEVLVLRLAEAMHLPTEVARRAAELLPHAARVVGRRNSAAALAVYAASREAGITVHPDLVLERLRGLYVEPRVVVTVDKMGIERGYMRMVRAGIVGHRVISVDEYIAHAARRLSIEFLEPRARELASRLEPGGGSGNPRLTAASALAIAAAEEGVRIDPRAMREALGIGVWGIISRMRKVGLSYLEERVKEVFRRKAS